jgi:hypothetical protein
VTGFRGLALLLIFAASGAGQTIQLVNGVFKIAGWRADAGRKDWSAIFAIYAGSSDAPAMLGTYSVEAGVLQFRPRFQLAPGVRYRAVFRPAAGPPVVEAWFDGPKRPDQASTRVLHVFPSAGVLPSNVLKFYIVFSAPMSRGEAWNRIHLLDEAGRPMQGAFLEIDQELWDPDFRRLTVLFDPGRIKRDLAPNLQLGVPVVDGRRYTLAIDRDFPDAHGLALAEGFRKPFRGGPVDRTPLDPGRWRITAPPAASRTPLSVRFLKPLDYALLERTIDVLGVAGPVPGTVALGREETEWEFTPAEPWKSGGYKLAIDTALEDLAGNRIGRPFDRNESDRRLAPEGKVLLPFEIR